jgi:hypothetical protein
LFSQYWIQGNLMANRTAQEREGKYGRDTLVRGNGDWNLIPEDKAEWVIFSVALLIVLGAALWIFR